jgi:nucleoside-diphosphate-sugar epimerase
MTRHIVFGTGQVGRHVVEQLVHLGLDVAAVNRSGLADIDGAEVIAGDATDPTFTTRVTADADAVYFCLNASNYGRWAEEFPPLQRGVLAGAQAAGARLVVLDNLYGYGPTHGRDLVETLPAHPTSAKAATRAAMTAELLQAHQAGRVEIAIGRASDYFGPGTTQSALGETVFGTALTGRAAQVMGNPEKPHSYSYTPDVAAALITLASQPAATGSVWHLPVAETRTTEEIIDYVYGLAGHRPRSFAAGRTTLRLAGLAKPAMREYLHTLYQFTDRWVVDDTKFRTAFGNHTTPLDDALAATLEWYRGNAGSEHPTSQRINS